MTTDPTFDGRRYLRVPNRSIVSVGRLDAREGLAHALDLSAGGIRFQCVGLDVEMKEILKVTLTLGDLTATFVGQIARVQDLDEFTQEVGLSFVKMDDELRRALIAHLPEPDPDTGWRDERRAYSRVRLESVVSVGRANLVDVVKQARDATEGGIRFEAEGMELELGDVLRVAVQLGPEVAATVGQIVRVTDVDDFRQEVAMTFLEIEPHHLEHLRAELARTPAEAARED